MDIYQKNRLFLWIIIVLLVVSLGSQIFLWVGVKRHRRDGKKEHSRKEYFEKDWGKGGVSDFMKKELGLNDEQAKKIDTLVKKHFDNVKVLGDSMRVIKDEISKELMSDQPDNQKVKNLCDKIGTIRANLEFKLYSHFIEVKAVCNKEQYEKFNEFVKHIMSRVPGDKDKHLFHGEEKPPEKEKY
jgi:hypothetical protein